VRLDERTAQYLYQDGDLYYFMDTETFDQTPLSSEQLGDALNYLKDGMTLTISRSPRPDPAIRGIPLRQEQSRLLWRLASLSRSPSSSTPGIQYVSTLATVATWNERKPLGEPSC
jgi:hypothetical protein